MERYFWGWRERDGTPQVRWADGGRGHLLSARRDLFNHSPCGFEWGYGGSGPAQLALAILCKVLHDDERAVQLYQQFKFRVVAGWGDQFLITEREVLTHIAAIECEQAARQVS